MVTSLASSYLRVLVTIFKLHQLRRSSVLFYSKTARFVPAEVLSASLERLMTQIHFSGKVSVVVQNGRVLKSGYEEDYFRNHPST
jgi:hypothetical protein